MGKIKKHISGSLGLILTGCFILYTVLLWVLLLRDGRAMYAIADFYPSVLPTIKYLEPLATHFGINSIPTLLFFVITIIAFACYFFSLTVKISLRKSILFSLLFQTIVFLSYPSLATDIFSYIFSDRVATVYHQNVWTTKPKDFSSDKFSRLADWQEQTRVYGGVNQFFYNVPSVAGKNDLFVTVILYKLLVWMFTILSMYVVYKIAKKYFPKKEDVTMRMIFWNPLFVLEILGSGHNDILMILFGLVGYYYFKEKKWFLSGILLALAVQVKLIIILLVVFLAIDILREKGIKSVASFLLSFTLVNLIIFFFMGIDPITFLQKVSFNLGVYWQSLANIVHRFFPQEKPFFTGGLIALFLGLVFYQLKNRSDPLGVYCLCILFYLFFFATAYWNWYVLWACVFVPFIPSATVRKTALIFSLTSALSYPLFWLALRFNHEYIGWHIFRYIVLSLIPFFCFIYYKKFGKR